MLDAHYGAGRIRAPARFPTRFAPDPSSTLPAFPPVTPSTPPPEPSCRSWRPAGPLDVSILRDAMTRAVGATDADGRLGLEGRLRGRRGSCRALHPPPWPGHAPATPGAGPDGPSAMLRMLEALAALEPSHTRRSEEQVRLPAVLHAPAARLRGVLQAAAIRPGDMPCWSRPRAPACWRSWRNARLGSRATGNLHLNEIADVAPRFAVPACSPRPQWSPA